MATESQLFRQKSGHFRAIAGHYTVLPQILNKKTRTLNDTRPALRYIQSKPT
jgi:hypothetical protein